MYPAMRAPRISTRCQDGVDFTDRGPESGPCARLCNCAVGQQRNKVVVNIYIFTQQTMNEDERNYQNTSKTTLKVGQLKCYINITFHKWITMILTDSNSSFIPLLLSLFKMDVLIIIIP